MRRILIAAAALATLVSPMAASAQSQGEVRHDKREVREEQRELKQERQRAKRDGVVTNRERREIQEERRDVRGAQQELRSDRRDMHQAQRFDRANRTWWKGRSDFNGYTGRRAAFSFNVKIRGQAHDVVSEAYLLRHGDHFIKFRVTCPKEKYEPAAERVGRFLEALKLPEPVAAGARVK